MDEAGFPPVLQMNGDSRHFGPDRVALDVSHGGHRRRIVHWTLVEPPLPHVPAPAIESVDVLRP